MKRKSTDQFHKRHMINLWLWKQWPAAEDQYLDTQNKTIHSILCMLAFDHNFRLENALISGLVHVKKRFPKSKIKKFQVPTNMTIIIFVKP